LPSHVYLSNPVLLSGPQPLRRLQSHESVDSDGGVNELVCRLEEEVKKWRGLALELADERDRIRDDSFKQKTTDARIVDALKEQVAKLKKLAQIKTEVVFEERRLRDELQESRDQAKKLEERL